MKRHELWRDNSSLKRRKPYKELNPQEKERLYQIIMSLPQEILFQILVLLPIPSVLSAACVCKRWSGVCNLESLWKHLHNVNFGGRSSASKGDKLLWKSGCINAANDLQYYNQLVEDEKRRSARTRDAWGNYGSSRTRRTYSFNTNSNILHAGSAADKRLFWILENGYIELLKTLGKEERQYQESQHNPVHTAILANQLEIVEYLLIQGSDVNGNPNDTCSPLNTAASYGSLDIVKCLLAQGADINNANHDHYYETPLVSAARNSHHHVLAYLLDQGAHLDPDAIDYIASKSETRIIEYLLTWGMDVNTTTSYANRSLLHLAAKSSFETTDLLLKRGANVNIMDNFGKTPIFEATNKQIIQLLLDFGADVNVRAPVSYTTPLHFHSSATLSNKRKEIVEILLQAGANMYLERVDGETPLHTAAKMGDLELVQLFIMWGMSPDISSSLTGETPLHSAAKATGNMPVVKLITSMGVNIIAQDDSGKTPLHCAAANGNADIVAYLLSCGSPVDMLDNWRESPLQKAVAHPYGVDTVQQLIAYGADVNRTDSSGLTPIVVAFRMKNKRMILCLEKGGAIISNMLKQLL